jgi:hypothetical protein
VARAAARLKAVFRHSCAAGFAVSLIPARRPTLQGEVWAAAGIATGYVLRNARGLSAGAQEAIYEAVKDMPVISLISSLSVVGTLGWVVSLVAAPMALRRAGAAAQHGALQRHIGDAAPSNRSRLMGHPLPLSLLVRIPNVERTRRGDDQPGSDRGSPNHGSTLSSKRVMAQIRSPVRVRT